MSLFDRFTPASRSALSRAQELTFKRGGYEMTNGTLVESLLSDPQVEEVLPAQGYRVDVLRTKIEEFNNQLAVPDEVTARQLYSIESDDPHTRINMGIHPRTKRAITAHDRDRKKRRCRPLYCYPYASRYKANLSDY